MNNRLAVGLAIGITVFLLLGTFGFFFWQQGYIRIGAPTKKVTPQKTTTETSQSETSSLLAPNQSSTNGTLGVSGVTGGGTSLQSNLGQQNTGSNSASTAETFNQYEKYKDSKSALYLDTKAGTGAAVTNGSKVFMYYKGWLTNGQLFDESRLNKASGQLQPLEFTEGDHTIIPGIEEGIFGMKVGGKRRIIVPPAVGYGAEGKDPIPPNAVLIFDVELLAVQ